VCPARIQGDHLASFFDAYLKKRGVRDLFKDSEYFEICGDLSKILGQRTITVLLARMYCNQRIALREQNSKKKGPASLRDIALGYVNELNRNVTTPDKIEDVIVHSVLKTAAWECVKSDLKPKFAQKSTVLAMIKHPAPEDKLRYVEERLGIVESIPPEKKFLQFSLDPLAEYLGAICIVDDWAGDPSKWRSFLKQASSQPKLEEVRGFLQAVVDCSTDTTPKFVTKALRVQLGEVPGD
jgi:hypothetical protein